MLGDRTVKRYRVRSPNQEAILAAFQEEGWPHHIDNPLSPLPDQCPKQRLHSTIKYLNSCQENRLVRFRGDGTGEGIVWEPVRRPGAPGSPRQAKAHQSGVTHCCRKPDGPCRAAVCRHIDHGCAPPLGPLATDSPKSAALDRVLWQASTIVLFSSQAFMPVEAEYNLVSGGHVRAPAKNRTCLRKETPKMGRIIAPVTIANPMSADKKILCDAFVDTGASHMVLPLAWKDRLGDLEELRRVELETATQDVIESAMYGPVRIQIEGFPPIASEVVFIDMHPDNGEYEPLIGYIPLEQSQAAVNMLGHRLIHVKRLDLK